MFEVAEVGQEVDKETYSSEVPKLRTELLKLQRRLSEREFPMIVLINGVDGAGKGELLNKLHEWLDTRDLVTETFDEATAEERQRPEYWRYWMALPPAGKIAIYAGNWYTPPIVSRTFGKIRRRRFEDALTRINAFEKTLADDGALIVKFWLHIKKSEQKKRLKKLEKSRATRWRVTDLDWEHHGKYDRFVDVATAALRETGTAHAPWNVIESADSRYRNLTVGNQLRDALRERLDSKEKTVDRSAPDPDIPNPTTLLDKLDLSLKLEKKEYEEELPHLQGELNRLARRLLRTKRTAILVFEGWDAGGKGGAIRRIIHALDARHFKVIPIAAPTEEEKAHHYLWRFWRSLPRAGRFTIYDRSWYGRVLVERNEAFAGEAEWSRAYKEINDFETQLVAHGSIVVKYWLHISPEEQLRRFDVRSTEPWKHHKLTQEDFRNREKWNLYEAAAAEMVARTSTEFAPWTLVEADDKRFARIKVLRTLCEALERAF